MTRRRPCRCSSPSLIHSLHHNEVNRLRRTTTDSLELLRRSKRWDRQRGMGFQPWSEFARFQCPHGAQSTPPWQPSSPKHHNRNSSQLKVRRNVALALARFGPAAAHSLTTPAPTITAAAMHVAMIRPASNHRSRGVCQSRPRSPDSLRGGRTGF